MMIDFLAARLRLRCVRFRRQASGIGIGACIIIAGMCVSDPAWSAPIPFTQTKIVDTVPNGAMGTTSTYSDTHATPPVRSGSAVSASGSWGGLSGIASAALATGALKAHAVESTSAVAQSTPFVETLAKFGDSFTTFGPLDQPYAWTPQTTASFSLALDGTAIAAFGAAPTSLSDAGGSVFALLSVLRHGTVSPTVALGGSDVIANYLYQFYGTTNSFFVLDDSGNPVPLTPTSTEDFGGLPASVGASFRPDGDFDFVITLGIAGGTGNNYSFDVDLGDTATLTYIEPAGATTVSASGLFTNIVPAPEPSGLSLLSVGLVLAGLVKVLGGPVRRSHDSNQDATASQARPSSPH